MNGGGAKIIEAALVEFFMRELEGTVQEFFDTLKVLPTAKERTVYRYALWRLRRKGILESIGYLGRSQNYRVSETAFERGLTNKRRGCYAIATYDSAEGGDIEPRVSGGPSGDGGQA